ncbi:MAG: NAD(P)H-hydrate dehydratase [Bacteroidales bacterium]|nr:NAD(P)H-hydrate dehydratase [Bacteroidales bacterium]
MKIFSSAQIRDIDDYTVRHEPVASVDLMERAAMKLLEWYREGFSRSRRILIFAGPGNNGGDGLALARLLEEERYEPELFYVHFSDYNTENWKINRERLQKFTRVPFEVIDSAEQFPVTGSGDVIIDAIFGSGLTRPVTGLSSEIIRMINQSGRTVIAIDIPSGLMGEDNTSNDPDSIVRADYTLSFQFPKLSFLFRENEKYAGKWTVLPIGLDTRAIASTKTPWELTEKSQVASVIKTRNRFDHKGIYGHGLLVGGSRGKMGAVVLGARAALRTGAGLVSCHVPACGNMVLQNTVPEAMVISDSKDKYISGIASSAAFNAFGIGPGMGTRKESGDALGRFLFSCRKPVVIDADALNLLSLNRKWLDGLPEKTILTPHPKEFERLAGRAVSDFQRLERQVEFSVNYKCVVVLKGAFTSVSDPSGNVWFNSTGNPGMATAGSGDVLTGMILSLLAQGYDTVNAALAGVFLHGLAGDVAAEKVSFDALIASDIVDGISEAYRRIREET